MTNVGKLRYVYFLICLIKCVIIIIGIYTHACEDDSMFICEMKTLRDLSAGLTQVCACGCLRWAMSDAIQSVLYERYSVNCSISVARTS